MLKICHCPCVTSGAHNKRICSKYGKGSILLSQELSMRNFCGHGML
ncbi:unnamed protein product [Strongylus vulgaris]|uniref:Uncharacterized protein n=1 Tax=Strongylus vulgaris TaxID=40348 RepID=A0A3P7JD96_STRVU|nr:unnamed protein product [Strongylus vulgaris]